jgi:hypothetical protein
MQLKHMQLPVVGIEVRLNYYLSFCKALPLFKRQLDNSSAMPQQAGFGRRRGGRRVGLKQ